MTAVQAEDLASPPAVPVEELCAPFLPARASFAPVPLRALTGLRFLAALLVVLYHVQIIGGVVIAPVAGVGYIGVSFFFILSGFILAYSYLDTQGTLGRGRRAFWVAWVARIYPIYLCAFVLGTLPFLWQHDPRANPAITAFSALTLTQAWLPWSADAWNGPGWSLSVEAFFYLLFPFVVVPIARLPRRGLFRAVNLLWLLALAGPLIYIGMNPDGLHTWGWADSTWIRVIRFDPLLRLPEFLMGVALGRMFVTERAEDAARGCGGLRSASFALDGFVPLAALAAIVAAPSLGLPLPYILLHNGLLDPLFGVLIYSAAWGKGKVGAGLASPLAVALGEASYALYILHIPVHDLLDRWMPAPAAADPRCVAYWIAYLALCVALSLLALRVIEQPSRRALRRLLVRPA